MSALHQALLLGGGYADLSTILAGSSGGLVGYFQGSLGGISPSTFLSDGKTLLLVGDVSSGTSFRIDITGFGSDPGSGYLNQVEINSVIYPGVFASYSFAGSTAAWTFAGGAGLVNGNYYPLIIDLA